MARPIERPDPATANDGPVAAVVVTFAPDPVLLSRVLEAVAGQVGFVVLADNGQGAGLGGLTQDAGRVTVIDMGGNQGVAAAQNAGIRLARERGARHLLLLDHDSICTPLMVERLQVAHRQLSAQGHRVAAVGANHVDPRRPEAAGPDRPAGSGALEVPHLISSGCLFAMEALAAIGPMEEALFIDYVDIEWGLRARAAGWRSYRVPDARLEHTLGDAPLRVFGRLIACHSPIRHYYMARNVTWMLGRRALPWRDRWVEAWRLLRRLAVYAVVAPDRLTRFRRVVQGVADGRAGQMGAWRGR